ncbi:zinc-finger homeodomain protein 6 [Lactuca sativa]|uniref:ZF-HD dimerization-type domain-containing protein n=1 Tax=Lactuca sativa TaxID=4236 RepID=A0A9R1XKQ8_LACSA|nr:zinc-finger homeodomain protein 6 [Lactuca sativa]KAJ0216771.1 hypothetical protein LSAT_V11C300131270 [Lactuca sativa]
METRERNSINYHIPPQSTQESSSTSNTKRNETPNHLHRGDQYRGFRIHKEQPEAAETPGRNSNSDPDPNLSGLVSQAPSQPLPLAPPPSTTSIAPVAVVVVRYRGCLRNHAANMGAHVLDGCGEFMPSGEDGTPEALKCAACECHRSFHRREVEGETTSQIPLTHNQPPPAAAVHLPPAPSSQQRHHRYYHHPMPPIMMAFGGAGGAPAESSSEDLNVFRTSSGVQLMAQTSKKRFRTKFTQEQKEKMQDFADRIGWKIQKQDEQELVQFCHDVGLKRQVFKVWMHNNKQATKKKEM